MTKGVYFVSRRRTLSDQVRVRMLKPTAGVVDGVSLSRLMPGLVYDLKPITANYLIASRCAEPVSAAEHPLMTPLDDPTYFSRLAQGVRVVSSPRDEAADRPGRRKLMK